MDDLERRYRVLRTALELISVSSSVDGLTARDALRKVAKIERDT
jgi:hypothetical protein